MGMLMRRHYNDEKPKAKENQEQEQEQYPRHTGGGYYELSNGEKVKGKEEAEKAEKEL